MLLLAVLSMYPFFSGSSSLCFRDIIRPGLASLARLLLFIPLGVLEEQGTTQPELDWQSLAHSEFLFKEKV